MSESSFRTLNAADLLDNLTSGAVICDPNGTISYANPELGRLLHQEANTLAGKPLHDLLQLPPKSDCALCLGVKGQESPNLAAFHIGFVRIESQNDAPEALKVKIKHSRLANQNLLTLIDPFSEDTTLTQAHSDFVSTVSHEFRTPLTSIKGFADTLLNYGGQLPDEEKRRFISIIKDQADRLIRLVENLLTASRLGASRVELSYRSVPLKRMLEKVTQSVQAKALAKAKTTPQFNLTVNPEAIEVWADTDKLEQVFINLLDNAVKYSPAGRAVSVRAEYLPDDSDWVRISVRDQGVGIPEALLPHIFTKFYRVESPLKQEVEGTGLGLYITQSLTTAMGGQISAESEPGQGSVFTVIFPAATPERQATYRRKLYAADPLMGEDS